MRGVFVLRKNLCCCLFLQLFIIFLLIIIFTNTFVLAVQDPDEDLGKEEFDQFLELVTADARKEPIINSRHAIVLERSTRQGIIWKKRK